MPLQRSKTERFRTPLRAGIVAAKPALTMKNIRRKAVKLLLALCAGALASTAIASSSTSVRYSVNAPMVATEVDTNATGRVQASVKQNGNSDRQRLRISVRHLDPSTPYTLLAKVGTNDEFITVTNFTTTSRGRRKLLYFERHSRRSNGESGLGSGTGKHALPEAVKPLIEVRELAIANTNGEVVLSVDLHQSETMNFQLASVFENTGNDPQAIGVMAVACQSGLVQFRLFAVGQTPEYILSVNDEPVAKYQADFYGGVNVGMFPSGAPSPMHFKKVALQNAGEQVILQSNVP
jgi:hypothetical protein